MNFISQSQMTADAVEKMFIFWDENAPNEPLSGNGWFGTMRFVVEENVYSCPIEDYDDDGAIIQIGTGRVHRTIGEYTEVIFV